MWLWGFHGFGLHGGRGFGLEPIHRAENLRQPRPCWCIVRDIRGRVTFSVVSEPQSNGSELTCVFGSVSRVLETKLSRLSSTRVHLRTTVDTCRQTECTPWRSTIIRSSASTFAALQCPSEQGYIYSQNERKKKHHHFRRPKFVPEMNNLGTQIT